METGSEPLRSPLVRALRYLEGRTSAEVRVHISQFRFEPRLERNAIRTFHYFGMNRTAHKNSVLLYMNKRKRKFLMIYDQGLIQDIDEKEWQILAQNLSEDLHSTSLENAISLFVYALSEVLSKPFPRET